MRIVWIAQDLHIGGGQRVICELSRVMVQRGHNVDIILPRGREGLPLPEGVRARETGLKIGSPIASLLVNFPFTLAAISECDWLLCSMPISAFSGYLAGKLRSARVLYYIMNDERAMFDDRSVLRSGLLLQTYHSLTDWAQKLPLTIAVNSRWTGSRVRRSGDRDYPIIPHGVDLDIFTAQGSRLMKGDLFTVCTVGRRYRWKGWDDLIAALNRVPEELASQKPFQLWALSQDNLDLSKAQFPVDIIKPKSDREIAEVLRTADLLVHPSWFEGFGLPPLEAMACGTPAVITDCGGVSEYARNEENCLLVPPRNPAAMARAISRLMNDSELLENMAQNGLQTASKFTWKHAADALEVILKSDR